MAPTDNAASDGKSRCVVCREEIIAGARLCTHCNTPQGWSRHVVGVASVAGAVVTVLSLVGAAVSLGGAWQTLQKLVPAPAKLTAIARACGRDTVELGVANLGDKPALLQSVTLRLRLDGSLREPVPLTAVAGAEIIEPHKMQPITYEHRVSGAVSPLRPTLTGVAACDYLITVETATIEGPGRPVEMTCACPAQ